MSFTGNFKRLPVWLGILIELYGDLTLDDLAKKKLTKTRRPLERKIDEKNVVWSVDQIPI